MPRIISKVAKIHLARAYYGLPVLPLHGSKECNGAKRSYTQCLDHGWIDQQNNLTEEGLRILTLHAKLQDRVK